MLWKANSRRKTVRSLFNHRNTKKIENQKCLKHDLCSTAFCDSRGCVLVLVDVSCDCASFCEEIGGSMMEIDLELKN